MNIPEANLRNMLKAISEGNHVLNEKVRLYKTSNSDCTDCDYDPIRKESTDINCETCGGTGSISTSTYSEIDASVEQEEDFKKHYQDTGAVTKGKIFVTIDIADITTTLNADSKYDLNDYSQMKSFVEQYNYLMWKGAKYTVESFEPGWLQGNLYEIGVTLSLIG
jgi:hypothetical protein